jgi:tRNA pseudouridine55 synthase
VVERIKKKFNVKAGHTGTLDPLATGLLVVLTGKYTKNASLFLKLDKAYEVKAVLGVETDTFDSEGRVLRRNDNEVTREELERVVKEFYGDIWQTPPSFSAKKMAGQKAYQLARKGISVDILWSSRSSSFPISLLLARCLRDFTLEVLLMISERNSGWVLL